jgi:hypothetical protein
MKKLLTSLAILLSLFSCTPDYDMSKPEVSQTSEYRMITVTNEGGSPQIYYTPHNQYNTNTRIETGETFTKVMRKGDMFTVIGMSYYEDNTHNYGAPNVTVTANIKIYVDSRLVKQGVDQVTYIVE